jgi:hypothetical protein
LWWVLEWLWCTGLRLVRNWKSMQVETLINQVTILIIMTTFKLLPHIAIVLCWRMLIGLYSLSWSLWIIHLYCMIPIICFTGGGYTNFFFLLKQ